MMFAHVRVERVLRHLVPSFTEEDGFLAFRLAARAVHHHWLGYKFCMSGAFEG